MSKPIRILGIAGSLRRESYNRAALRAATQLVPEGATIDIFELDGIPGFNQDEEQNPPAQVGELKRRIRAADAILIVDCNDRCATRVMCYFERRDRAVRQPNLLDGESDHAAMKDLANVYHHVRSPVPGCLLQRSNGAPAVLTCVRRLKSCAACTASRRAGA